MVRVVHGSVEASGTGEIYMPFPSRYFPLVSKFSTVDHFDFHRFLKCDFEERENEMSRPGFEP